MKIKTWNRMQNDGVRRRKRRKSETEFEIPYIVTTNIKDLTQDLFQVPQIHTTS